MSKFLVYAQTNTNYIYSPRRGPPPRGPPRDRDDDPNVSYFGAGESYRPGGSSGEGPYRPARERDNDRYNPPPREERRRDNDIDSYIPPTSIRAQRTAARSRSPPPYRRRSRSPPPGPRGRPELFPERGARRFSPERERPRSPPRRRSRSPYRARDFTPDSRRSRDSPPRNRFDRSPPRRPLSPERNSYRPRSRTPPRGPTYAAERWRRSPSPRGSGTTSRRSSPPAHLDRTSLGGSRPHSPARDRPRYDDRRDDGYASRPRSPPPPRDDYMDRDDERRDEPAIPTGPRSAGYGRAPPPGPSRNFSGAAISPPPTGPPSGPRGAPSGPRGAPPRDFASPPGAVRGRTSLTYRAPGYRPPLPNQPSFESPSSVAPPSGPRASSFSSRGDFSSSRGSYPTGPSRQSSSTHQEFPFRPGNTSTSSTYPRSQRFDTAPRGPPAGPSSLTTTFSAQSPITPATPSPANFVKSQLATLEKIVPGGKHVPGSTQSTNGLSAEQERKLKGLEDDEGRLRGEVSEKQKAKREALREWEVRERETEIASLRSELADGHLRSLVEEDSAMVGAAF